MKKTTSLLLAMVSTMFLNIGATRAAEKFDTLAQPKDLNNVKPVVVNDDGGPALPCIVIQHLK